MRRLIDESCDGVAFFVAEANYDEAVHYLAELAPARGISEEVWQAALSSVMAAIQIVAHEELLALEAQARARIARRDVRDGPAVAAAMQFDCPVWTEDQDFSVPGCPRGPPKQWGYF